MPDKRLRHALITVFFIGLLVTTSVLNARSKKQAEGPRSAPDAVKRLGFALDFA